MKYLGAPMHDDLTTLRRLAENSRVKSYPMLRQILGDVENSYAVYHRESGNAKRINPPIEIAPQLASALKTHYSTKPGDLSVIEEMRVFISPDVCPMCGSAKIGQLDHVAPKDTYPELSFYTKNLVPACDCNNLKKLAFRGAGVDERILHPYYDRIMSEPLTYVLFSGDLDAPDMAIVLMPSYENNPAVLYHVENILRKTTILVWAAKKWADVNRMPEKMFPLLKTIEGRVQAKNLEEAIAVQTDAKDDEFGTPNNWYSIIYRGLVRSPHTLEYLVEKINLLRQHL